VQASAESQAVRELRVEVDAERVRRATERAYRDLGRKVRVRGFRPGKAPRSVLERLYGAVLAEDLERSLVAETLPEAIESAGLSPVSEPSIETSAPEEGKPFHYTVRLEVKPEIELPELRGLAARRPQVEVSDAEVATELESLRQRHASLVEEPEDALVARGHVVTVHFDGQIEGKPFEGGSGREAKLEIGSGRSLPEFEEQLVGASAGEQREIRVRYPDDHPKPELAGRVVDFSVQVVSVQRREIPPLDDEFAKDVGDFESLDALRQRVHKDLLTAHEREARAVLRRTLLDALLERVTLEVPPGVIERRLRRRLDAARQELGDELPPPALHSQLTRWEQEWRPLTEREIREEWVLEAVARQQGLSVSDEELDRRLAELAEEQGMALARLRKAYARAGVLDALRARMLEERALEFLLGGAKVEETSGA
jgi:trigger factor